MYVRELNFAPALWCIKRETRPIAGMMRNLPKTMFFIIHQINSTNEWEGLEIEQWKNIKNPLNQIVNSTIPHKSTKYFVNSSTFQLPPLTALRIYSCISLLIQLKPPRIRLIPQTQATKRKGQRNSSAQLVDDNIKKKKEKQKRVLQKTH